MIIDLLFNFFLNFFFLFKFPSKEGNRDNLTRKDLIQAKCTGSKAAYGCQSSWYFKSLKVQLHQKWNTEWVHSCTHWKHGVRHQTAFQRNAMQCSRGIIRGLVDNTNEQCKGIRQEKQYIQCIIQSRLRYCATRCLWDWLTIQMDKASGDKAWVALRPVCCAGVGIPFEEDLYESRRWKGVEGEEEILILWIRGRRCWC